jgi:hypothetical protein
MKNNKIDIEKGHIVIEQEENKNNVVPFQKAERLATDPKPPDTEGNWLKKLEDGTVFLARRKQDATFVLTEYLIYNNKPEIGTWLVLNTGSEQMPLWVDSERFSQQAKCIEILKVIKEEDNGDSDREHEDVAPGEGSDVDQSTSNEEGNPGTKGT